MGRILDCSGAKYLARPLDTLLATPSHIAVLRALRDTAAGATGRAIAREAHVAPQAALDALGRLESVGVVRRQAAGAAYLFVLNRRHRLVRDGLLALLDAERKFRSALDATLRKGFHGSVTAAAVFGSVARGEETASSDLDVCLIVENAAGRERALARSGELAAQVAEEFGIRLAPIAYSLKGLVSKHRKGDSLVRNIVSDGRSFLGPPLAEIVRG